MRTRQYIGKNGLYFNNQTTVYWALTKNKSTTISAVRNKTVFEEPILWLAR